MYSTYIAAASLIVAMFAVVYAFSARSYARSCYDYVANANKSSVTLRQLTEIQTELTEHADSIKSLLGSLHKLRSRIHARTVNEKKRAAADDVGPDPKEDPEGWKRWMNARIAPQARKE